MDQANSSCETVPTLGVASDGISLYLTLRVGRFIHHIHKHPINTTLNNTALNIVDM